MSKPALEVKGLTKKIGNKTVVNNLSFSIKKGEIFGLLGPNGAGKTTTIRMIAGLISKTKGNVFINGVNTDEDFIEAMKQIGAIVENPEMINYLTGYLNLVHYARMARVPITTERMEEVVRFVKMQDAIHQKVKTYSLGMKQRLGVAQAILHRPPVLILDEPTNGLDPQGIYELREYLRLLANEGVSILISSHLLSEMQSMCDRVAIIQEGKLIGVNTVGELTDDGTKERLVQIEVEDTKGAHAALSTAHPELEVSVEDGNVQLMIPREDIPMINKTLVEAGNPVFSISGKKHTLEEKFLEITKAGDVG